jgi:hypothetical protein
MKLEEKLTVKQLEKKLGQLIPLQHFLVTGFSRNAFYLLIKAFAWEKPAEIIIPAFTCPVIKHTVEAANVIPVPVDAEEGGLNIDPHLIEKAISPNTKAIYVVHTYGTPAKIQKICAIARENHLIVIEDLAHSLFTMYNGNQLGTYGDFAILSFTKQIINFEGGAVVTNNTEIYLKMLKLREQYRQQGKLSISSLIDSYVRMVGSWWESGFSVPSLCLMNINDWLNNAIYKGSYGISIDFTRFYASNMGSRLALLQLEKLYKKKIKLDDGWNSESIITTAEKIHSPYNVGLASDREIINRLLSFRTWHNPNKNGIYPRSDCLYRQLRIFCRAKSYFQEKPNVIPESQKIKI